MSVLAPPRPTPSRQATPPAVTAHAWRLRALSAGSRWWLLFAVVGVAGFAARYLLLTRGGGLLGNTGYDDGVYYAAADALVHGRLPYRDFLLIQPPGILLALAPFAWLGSLVTDPTGVAAARLTFVALGAGNAVLVAAVVRRYGFVAAAVGGGMYAVFLPAVYAERSTLLEPLGTFLVLIGLLLLGRAPAPGRRAALWAGIALGLAATVKIWFIVPVLVLAAFAGRHRLRYAVGAGTGLAVVYLPFLVAAPSATVRQIVLDQLGRPRTPTGLIGRLAAIVGAPHGHAPAALRWMSSPTFAAVLLLAAAALALLAWLVPDARRYVVLLVADTVVLLAGPSWFPHYTALTAPLLAIVTGIGLARATRRLWRPARLLAAAAVLLVVLGSGWGGLRSTVTKPFPAAALTPAAAAVRGCVASDDPFALAALNVLSRDYARGCTVWPDVTGWTYDRDALRDSSGTPVPRAKNAQWQRHLLTYLTPADAFLRHRGGTGASKATKAVIATHPVLAQSGTWKLRAGDRTTR